MRRARHVAECDQLSKWLVLNLGRRALAPLTGTDSRALAAAAHILMLYATSSQERLVLEAFRAVVLTMQPSTREFAYHAIACYGEWHWRDEVWLRAGLPPLDRVQICAGEPAGRERDAALEEVAP
jgi:hypothetical protein